MLGVNPYFSPGNNEIRIHGKCTLFWETLSFTCEFIHGFVMQVVIFDSRVKTPQVGLYALAKALSQKGVAKKIQVHFSLYLTLVCNTWYLQDFFFYFVKELLKTKPKRQKCIFFPMKEKSIFCPTEICMTDK